MLVDGQPFGEVNPKGYVPALILDDGSMLTENVAILDWIAQQSLIAPTIWADGALRG